MNHLDLFSGIGGFALAADSVWDDVNHTFCDNEPFAQAVLSKHWPNARIYGDIRTLQADRFDTDPDLFGRVGWQTQIDPAERGEQALDNLKKYHGTIDLLTGGFPCQPFSQAGRRQGTSDDRYLWPEMLRVIREFHPRWVIGENVGGLVTWSEGLVLEQVHADLEAEGYEVQAFIIPACAVNAPHRRDRVWIVAHAEHGTSRNAKRRGDDSGTSVRVSGSDTLIADPAKRGRGQRYTDSGRRSEGTRSKKERKGFADGTGWSQSWLEVATRLCRVDDGLPRRLDRNSRLKALGNAIVPQVAAEIMRAIRESDG